LLTSSNDTLIFPLTSSRGNEGAQSVSLLTLLTTLSSSPHNERTPVGAERSGALGGFAESCAAGLSWHNRPGEGETKSIVSEFQKWMRMAKRACESIQKKMRMELAVPLQRRLKLVVPYALTSRS